MVDKLYTSKVGLCSLNTSTSFLLLLEMASGKEVSIAAFSSAALVPKRGSQLDETLQTTQKLKTFLKKYGKILLNGFKRKINFLPFFHFVKNSKKNLTFKFFVIFVSPLFLAA